MCHIQLRQIFAITRLASSARTRLFCINTGPARWSNATFLFNFRPIFASHALPARVPPRPCLHPSWPLLVWRDTFFSIGRASRHARHGQSMQLQRQPQLASSMTAHWRWPSTLRMLVSEVWCLCAGVLTGWCDRCIHRHNLGIRSGMIQRGARHGTGKRQ